MAIPNPNPNIRDYEKADNFTWSSNKIDDELSEVKSEIPTTEDIESLINSALNEDITIELAPTVAEGDLTLPTIKRIDNMVIVSMYETLKAGTYTEFYKVNVTPIKRAGAFAYIAGNKLLYIDTDGTIKPSPAVTVTGDTLVSSTLIFFI